MQTAANGAWRLLIRRSPLALLSVALLAGCSTDMLGSRPTPTAGSTSTSSPSLSFGGVSDFFRGQPQKTAADTSAADSAIDCPTVDIRQGASTYSQNAPGGDQSALSLRLQGTFGQTARECHINAGMLTIKVGVQGRLILGPAGAPGDVTVPIRYALVQEGVEPKTLWTKFYQVPVNIPQGNTNVPFTHVEDDMTVPLPKPADLSACVIYVGFDPAGLNEPKKPKSKPQPKPTARTSSAGAPR